MYQTAAGHSAAPKVYNSSGHETSSNLDTFNHVTHQRDYVMLAVVSDDLATTLRDLTPMTLVPTTK